jgi:hypothetical protein
MITDQNLIFTTASAAITGSTVIGDVVDLAAVRDVGEGKTLYAYVYVKTAFGGTGTVTFQVKSSSDSTIQAADATIGSSNAVAVADLTVGKAIAIKLNPQLVSIGAQYIGLWAAASATPSSGVVGACLVLDIQDGKKSYATNIVTGD